MHNKLKEAPEHSLSSASSAEHFKFAQFHKTTSLKLMSNNEMNRVRLVFMYSNFAMPEKSIDSQRSAKQKRASWTIERRVEALVSLAGRGKVALHSFTNGE